ncbi:MAG TPA: ComF family protein [Candidatus Merdisoma merdipullorum]|nr:ComF family protein [Candidatus Merdisoma merdipullorum]
MEQNRNGIQVFARLLNLIYPRRCPICDGLTGSFQALICRECIPKLRPVKEPACKKCGKPLEKEEAEYCADCSRGKHLFTRGRAAFVYDSRMRGSIGRFKYRNRREYADFYAEELANLCGEAVLSWRPDALIPVPLHRSRQRKRGFNQAELVAKRLGRRLNIPVTEKTLFRIKKTSPQKELSDTQRRANLKNAFQVRENDVRLKRVVLIDDIYTTGSTVDAAASVLLEHGVENVYFLAICIGTGF